LGIDIIIYMYIILKYVRQYANKEKTDEYKVLYYKETGQNDKQLSKNKHYIGNQRLGNTDPTNTLVNYRLVIMLCYIVFVWNLF
jgi:hypothetical protein